MGFVWFMSYLAAFLLGSLALFAVAVLASKLDDKRLDREHAKMIRERLGDKPETDLSQGNLY